MLGTDSRAAKLPSTIGNHSRTAKSSKWCHVVGRFPDLDLSLLTLPSSVPTWLHCILANSRPLFAKLVSSHFYNKFTGIDTDFDALMKNAFSDLISVKNIFGDFYGKFGQLRLFQNAHCSLEDRWENQSTPLIHSHFAQLGVPKKNFVLMTDGHIQDHDDPWKPSSAFPNVQNDLLLYLLLMGGKYYHAFQRDGQQVPYSHF